MRDHDTSSPPASRDDGFTLVEILIAIVLVGVLSAVVVVGISSLTSKGSAAACTASLDAARTGSTAYYASNAAYPTTLVEMTSATPPSLNLPGGVTLNSVAAGANPAGTVATGSGWTLTMVAGTNGNPPTFSCGSGAALPLGSTAGS